MQNHANKFLLGFLGFGLLVCFVSWVSEEQASVELQVDSSNMNPIPSIDRFSVDRKPILQSQISLDSYRLEVEGATYWKLPRHLTEISGLAMSPDNRLLAHNDETAIIYEIDYRKGLIVKAFQLADMETPIADDFEGVATVDDQIYLVTSSGRLYECSEGTTGESMLFNVYATGVGRNYEIEGLAYDADQQALLLMCKGACKAKLKDQLVIYHWSIDEKRLSEDAHIVIPITEFSRHIKGKKFQPSGIERHPTSGNYFVIAARQRAIAEITAEGQVLAVKQFLDGWHRQAEGITFAADGVLIIADEGAKKKSETHPVSSFGKSAIAV